MASIELRNIWHRYDKKAAAGDRENVEYAVENIQIKWEDGSANALLGPSGCGKTTLLNIISGLIQATKGEVLFDGEDVTSFTTKERHIAQVFQFPVVYDSMNVFGNLAFPLRNDGVPEHEVKKRVEDIAELLEITDLLKESVTKITPADKQKVALGRGIVRSNTSAVLLDEPLTVIDPKAQWYLRRKLKQAQRELSFTMIYVTHDQHEALTFADHVTVMNVGRFDQTGTPKEIHDNPESPFVGYFIGSPGMNLIETTLNGENLTFDVTAINISPDLRRRLEKYGKDFKLGIRPEYVEVSDEARKGWLQGTVKLLEDTGVYKILTVTLNQINVKTRVPEEMQVKEGDSIWIHFPEKHIKIFKDDKII